MVSFRWTRDPVCVTARPYRDISATRSRTSEHKLWLSADSVSGTCSSSSRKAWRLNDHGSRMTLIRHCTNRQRRPQTNEQAWLPTPPTGQQLITTSVRPRPHEQQCRSNIVECRKSNDSFDKVETNWTCSICFDFVERIVRLVALDNVASTVLLRRCCWCGRGLIQTSGVREECDIGQSGAVQWAAAVVLMPLLLFAAYTAAVTPSTLHWPGNSQNCSGDLCYHQCYQQADIHTDNAACAICRNRSQHAMHAMPPKK